MSWGRHFASATPWRFGVAGDSRRIERSRAFRDRKRVRTAFCSPAKSRNRDSRSGMVRLLNRANAEDGGFDFTPRVKQNRVA